MNINPFGKGDQILSYSFQETEAVFLYLLAVFLLQISNMIGFGSQIEIAPLSGDYDDYVT